MPTYPVTSGHVTIRFEHHDRVSVYDKDKKISLEGNHDFGYLLSACDGERTVHEIKQYLVEHFQNRPIFREPLNNTFTSLCQSGILNFSDKAINKPLRIRWSRHKYSLDTVYIEPTRRCNLKCIHCYANAPSFTASSTISEISTRRLKRLLKELDDFGVMHCCFTGGEPFFRKDFPDILEKCYTLGMETAIFTNGTLLSDRALKVLTHIKPKFVAISIDSHQREVYSKIRGADSLSVVLHNIDRLVNSGIRVRINCIVFRGLNDSANDIKRLLLMLQAHHIGSQSVTFDQFSPEGEGTHKRKYEVDREKVVRNIQDAFREVFQHDVTPDHLESAFANKEKDFCGIGTSMLNITSEGKVTLCPALTGEGHEVCVLDKDSLSKAWETSSPLRFFRTGQPIRNSECSNCEWIATCHGGCKAKAFTSSGSFNHPDRWMCAFYNSVDKGPLMEDGVKKMNNVLT